MPVTSARFIKIVLLVLLATLLTGVRPLSASAQKKADAEQTKKAVERSENAANILKAVVGTAENGIPRELLDKAQAIAVFPHVVKAKMLFQHLTVGYGVISRRLPDGWSQPAYYGFSGTGLEFNLVGGESADLIMLFMNDKAADWFQKGRLELKGEKKAVAGPVGAMPVDGGGELANANIVLYMRDKGQLAGASVSSNLLFKSFGIIPDNKLNKAIYNAKSRDTLAGRTGPSATPGVAAFHQALTTHLPRE
jgi:lipid-binding SYLF domain-containing protein